jgi:hypothetical protein
VIRYRYTASVIAGLLSTVTVFSALFSCGKINDVLQRVVLHGIVMLDSRNELR